jgi:hypothetical protein
MNQLQAKRHVQDVLFHLNELVAMTNANIIDSSERDNNLLRDMQLKYKQKLAEIKKDLISNCVHEFANNDIESNISDCYCIKCELYFNEIHN